MMPNWQFSTIFYAKNVSNTKKTNLFLCLLLFWLCIFLHLKNKENKSGPEIFILLQQLMSDKKYVSSKHCASKTVLLLSIIYLHEKVSILKHHDSEIRVLCWLKLSNEIHQKLPYFGNKKLQICT